MKLILVRHGESENNAGIVDSHDSNLTSKGRKQAELLAKRLKKEKWNIDKIISSELHRSRQTAEIISKELGIPISESFQGLNEYNPKILKSRLKLLFDRRLRDLRKILRYLETNHHKNETVMIVAHGITNKLILGHSLKFPLKRSLLNMNQYNTGISELYLDKKYGWTLRFWNDARHLPKELMTL